MGTSNRNDVLPPPTMGLEAWQEARPAVACTQKSQVSETDWRSAIALSCLVLLPACDQPSICARNPMMPTDFALGHMQIDRWFIIGPFPLRATTMPSLRTNPELGHRRCVRSCRHPCARTLHSRCTIVSCLRHSLPSSHVFSFYLSVRAPLPISCSWRLPSRPGARCACSWPNEAEPTYAGMYMSCRSHSNRTRTEARSRKRAVGETRRCERTPPPPVPPHF